MMAKILFLPRWYPNRYDALPGLFIRKMAESVSLHYEVTVFYVQKDEQAKDKIELVSSVENGVLVIRVYYRGKDCRIPLLSSLMNAMRFFNAELSGLRSLDLNSFSLVHVHVLTRQGLVALLLRVFRGKPYIITEHWTRYIPENRGFTGIIRKTITRMILRRAAAATTVSSYLKSAMQDCGLDHKKFLIIPNVVDTGLFTIPGNDGNRNLKRIIHVSNFHERAKNIFGILRVISILRKKRQDFEVLFVGGKEPFLENAKEYASGLGLESPVVVFKGRLTAGEIAAAYGESSFLLMFSNFESFSVVIPEALACGIPVVATSAGGIPEYFDNEAGRLVSPGDEPGLLDSLSFMLDHCHTFDPNGLRSLVESRFGHDSVGRQFDDLYSSV